MLAITDTFKKMFAFVEERLVSGEIDRLSVFLAEDGQTILEVHPVGVKNKLLLMWGNVIEDGHLLVAHNHKTLFLEWVEPTHEYM